MNRANPANWWRVTSLGDGVTRIDEPLIHEFYRCNVWHVRGRDRDRLVDSGMGVVSLRTFVPLVTERPLEAVASHTHFDHIGCHHEFPCRSCHAAEAHLLRSPTRQNTFADRYVTDDIFTTLPPRPYHSATYAVERAPATRLLWDGDRIDLAPTAGTWMARAGRELLSDADALVPVPLHRARQRERRSPAQRRAYRGRVCRLQRRPPGHRDRIVRTGHCESGCRHGADEAVAIGRHVGCVREDTRLSARAS